MNNLAFLSLNMQYSNNNNIYSVIINVDLELIENNYNTLRLLHVIMQAVRSTTARRIFVPTDAADSTMSTININHNAKIISTSFETDMICVKQTFQRVSLHPIDLPKSTKRIRTNGSFILILNNNNNFKLCSFTIFARFLNGTNVYKKEPTRRVGM